ncbi:hypothetical protein K1719_024784 [Acacia pycnantha]|nr:hypothetical protein K1719_024784 [Acacia pycnantha]
MWGPSAYSPSCFKTLQSSISLTQILPNTERHREAKESASQNIENEEEENQEQERPKEGRNSQENSKTTKV